MGQPKNAQAATESLLRAFGKIVDFVSELNVAFGSRFHEVLAYNHLLSKTKVSQKLTIQHHIAAFKEFFDRNKEAILSKDASKIMSHRISFSERVYLDVHALLVQPDLDAETADAIWKHLLVINASIDPTSEARAILQQLQGSGGAENQFLDGFFNRIQQTVETSGMPTTDPMTTAAGILQSGVLNDLVGGIDRGVKDGSLDIGKLIGTVQGMLGSLTSMGGPPGAEQGAAGANPLGGLDIGAMLNMMMGGGLGGMMGGMMAQAGQAAPGAATASFSASLQTDKAKAAIEAHIEAELKRERGQATASSDGPQIEVMEDEKSASSDRPDEPSAK